MSKRFRCYGCHKPFGLEFEASEPVCPSCNSPYMVVKLVDVHWLLPGGGPIPTTLGPHHVACMPDRGSLYGLSATCQADAVTCPRCKNTAEHPTKLAEFLEANQAP